MNLGFGNRIWIKQMKKENAILFYIIVSTFILSCGKSNPTTEYNKVAMEFIKEIFADDYFSCSYIIKPHSDDNLLNTLEEEMPESNYRIKISEILNIEKQSVLDSVIDLSKNFEYKKSMFNRDTKLIEQREFNSIKKMLDSVVKYGSKKEIDSIFAECPREFYFISKPIFDKNYKIAVIDIQIGFGCLRSPLLVYYFENGKWVTE